MSEWKEKAIEDCADILDNMRIPVNEEERAKNPGTIPYYGANGQQGFIAGYLFNEPLILMVEDGGYFDEYTNRPVAYKISGKSWVNNHAHILRPKKDIDFDFMFYSLEHKNVLPFIKGGTRAKLNQLELRTIKILAPSFIGEQKKIATILTSIDNAIEKTEALITKYQQIKAGLMHDLFTRGVTPDGKLRPPREQAPELYKETPIGWIPKEWGQMELGQACDWYSGGTPSRRNEKWWDGNIPWLSPKDMKTFQLENTEEHITKEAAAFGSRLISPNTVFIVVRGMILAHSFPVVISQREFCFNQDIKAVVGRDHLSNFFLAYWFVANKDLFLKKTTEATHGTKRFDMKDLYEITIGIPSTEEQKRIVDRLDTIEHWMSSEKEYLSKLNLDKQGLMHDLLTGKVRVKVDQEETANV